MERKYIFTRRELEEFSREIWMDGFYDGQNAGPRQAVYDRYVTYEKDINDRIKRLECECHTGQ